MSLKKIPGTLHTAVIDSPCGKLFLAATDTHLVACDWVDGWHRATVQARLERHLAGPWIEGGLEASPLLAQTAEELEEFFAGHRKTFDLPLLFLGTDFQKAVWTALQKIPFGELRTYAEVAVAAGRPSAFRAAAGAVGENPFSIIVPCHRVIGSDRSITGYGGGYAAKRLLLSLEGHQVSQPPQEETKAADAKGGAARHGKIR